MLVFRGVISRVKHFCSFLCVISKRRRDLRWKDFLKTTPWFPFFIHTKANFRVRSAKAKGKSSSICIHTNAKIRSSKNHLTTSCLKSRMLSSTKFSHLHGFWQPKNLRSCCWLSVKKKWSSLKLTASFPLKIGHPFLVGGFNPSEKYATVKLDHFPKISGWK